ncbi:MAG TPA: helix-turn-helix domain-containing protein [Candidatus Baltobacteraceae bacterium]|jgi:transcriptional regulator with XRE-family HTH domain|nr:helix-turn-helix domain-containing protein [Candidatus Baltobacteraceae bacterium]
MTVTEEADRHAKLRAFLIECRSRLKPTDVGLPLTPRRRVVGLRREEVAELAGISSDWYRWFESGRPIRVSAPFLSRLSHALRLSKSEQRTLYALAVPELYEADIAEKVSMAHLPLVTPVTSAEDIPRVLRQVSDARDAFFAHDAGAVTMVRPRILNSWQRSLRSGASPLRQRALLLAENDEQLASRRYAARFLLDAASPTIASLQSTLRDSGYAIVLTDAEACILYLSGDREILRRLSRIDFAPGTDLRECSAGTNAVGTVLVDGRPLQLLGAENFSQAGSDLTCTGAPIRQPGSQEIVGVLDVTADCKLIVPNMLSIVTQAALEIEERLASTGGVKF